jgi:hypothetical protein
MGDLYAVPSNVYVDPTMDMIIAALPLWMWLLIFLLIIIIFTNFFWFYRRMIMTPVLGYLEAFKTGTPQTIFLGKNKSFSIKYLEYVDGVLAFKDITNISKWLVQSPKSVGRLGGLSTLIVRDNYDYSVDPIAEIALCKLAEIWNKNPNHEENVIVCYNDFEILRKNGALEAEFPKGIPIPLYSIFDPSLIQKYLPSMRSAGVFGSHLTQKAKEMRADKTQEKWYEKYFPIGVASSVALVMLILSYMYASG